MQPKTTLVTGGAGFIGSNLINHLLQNTNDKILLVDKLTYAADKSYVQAIDSQRVTFLQADICNAQLMHDLFSDQEIGKIYHLAAESHVDNSIATPDVFVQTNVIGTFNLLSAARLAWMDAPYQFKSGMQDNRFLHVSTDEVYGSLKDNGLFSETTAYDPSSPYSASKASSDHFAKSFHCTYGLPVIVSNCSNNYGPRQHDEKLIPVIICNALSGKPIPIYGNGTNVRDWLYVEDHCTALERVMNDGKLGETYNIGGHNEIKNIVIAEQICRILDSIKPKSGGGSYQDQITFVKDRPGHDYRYAIDASKIEYELGWTPQETFESGIKKTVDWYLKKYER